MFPIETGEDKGAAGNTADAAKTAAFIRQRQTAANRGQQLLNIGPLRPTTTSSGHQRLKGGQQKRPMPECRQTFANSGKTAAKSRPTLGVLFME